MPHRTLSLHEAAELLHVPVPELERLVKKQLIPFERRAGRVVFRKADLENWASQRILRGDPGELSRFHPMRPDTLGAQQPMLRGLIRPEWVEPALAARTRPSVIREMVAVAARTGWVHDPAELIQTLEAREELCPTAVPGGVAFLHPRVQQPWRFERSFVALGRVEHPIYFGAPDQEPTRLFFLLCCLDDASHLRLLARLCLLAQRTAMIQVLLAAADAEAMCEAVLAAEEEALG
ncbi:PTS sugar transporter subunit IIA [Limisphaera sp. 4302-co]|uniref:PTS sugar transporter subunit IIA n=1 Tax=Limisphaera sp. 4302-co TaxID=3400417 RepID=UPI003C1E59CF